MIPGDLDAPGFFEACFCHKVYRKNEIEARPMQVKPIIIPWSEVRKDSEWLNVTQAESYTVSYVLRHPEVVAPDLELLGTEVALPDGEGVKSNRTPAKLAFADIVFATKDRRLFYLVEAKESEKQKSEGVEQAAHNSELLQAALRKNGIESEVIAIFAAVRYPHSDEYGYLQGQKLG